VYRLGPFLSGTLPHTQILGSEFPASKVCYSVAPLCIRSFGGLTRLSCRCSRLFPASAKVTLVTCQWLMGPSKASEVQLADGSILDSGVSHPHRPLPHTPVPPPPLSRIPSTSTRAGSCK